MEYTWISIGIANITWIIYTREKSNKINFAKIYFIIKL